MSKRNGLVFASLVVALALFSTTAFAACIEEELANFEIHNFQALDVSGFELTLQGDYVGKMTFYVHPGGRYGTPTVSPSGGNTVIRWDFTPVMAYCEWIHMGARLDPGVQAPVVIGSRLVDAGGGTIANVPFPWQRWEGTVECPVVDLIDGNGTIPTIGVRVARQAAMSWSAIPLQNLTPSDPMVTGLPWTGYGIQMLYPDSTLTLMLFTSGEEAAVVQYSVSSYDGTDQYMVFLSEAILTYGPSAAEESTWGRIKSMYR